MMIELFIFDDLEEAFRNGIVPAVALATHGLLGILVETDNT